MDIARHWRLRDQRYQLQGTTCTRCGNRMFPPRIVCPECRSREMEPFNFSGRGRIYSHTTVYQAPEGFEAYVPYVAALVRLDEGPLVSAQLTDIDPEEVTIDMPVEMVTRKLTEQGENGLVVYGYKFRPQFWEK
jgi:hypothetical protein